MGFKEAKEYAGDFIQNNLYSVNTARLHDMIDADIPPDAIASIINSTAQKKNSDIRVTSDEIAGYAHVRKTVNQAPIVLIPKPQFDAAMNAVESGSSPTSGTPDTVFES
ncbi:hypothetical protein [Enterobacter hormaechei]|uniref:hypothetical protein n=1 Tax=Enterobacter hormaechei TaxID=158836 RepID=UPI0013D1581C|nr:hypothetical protein [Enterobacter hormaechei]EDK1561924.1 hypothetical protein [Salmonella enterica subsp. enterica serovar Newport]EKK9105953.1 hypothetical protein [Salmonella enterica]